MATGSSQTTALVVAFVVGVGVGWAIGTYTATPGTIFSVVVGPSASDVFPSSVTLSRGHGDMATWTAKDPGKTLFIEFTEQPFQGMQPQTGTGRYRVACQGGRCDSGSISQSAPYKDYKYWQTLVDVTTNQQDTADGHIIINR